MVESKNVLILKNEIITIREINKMKKLNRFAAIIILLVGLTSVPAMAADTEVSVGADLVSSYVWRGVKFGEGAALQPYVEIANGGFAIGAWGSFGLAHDDALEADLYVGYGFENGLYIGLTDYYFPGSDYFEYSGEESSHAFELNLGYEIGNVSLSGNVFLNDSSEGAGTVGDDMYFELGYSFGLASLFVGAGDGWHTSDGDFALCNVGISAEKEITVTDTFTLPLFGSVILNPDSEQMYIVVGMSF